MGWFAQGLTIEAIGIVVEVILIVVILQYFRDRRRKRLLQPAIQRALLRVRRDAVNLGAGFEAAFAGERDEVSVASLVEAIGELEIRLDQLIVSSHDLLGTRMMRRLIEVHRLIGAVAYLIDSEIADIEPARRQSALLDFVVNGGRERLERLLEKLTSSLHLLAIY